MRVFNTAQNGPEYSGTKEKQKRQYNMICYISWSLIAAALLLIPVYFMEKLWYLVIILTIAIFSALINLLILKRRNNTVLSGHILSFLVYLTVISTNYLVWGLGIVHSQWFYIMPLLAAILSGMRSLLFYSITSIIMLIVFGISPEPAYYALPHFLFMLINWINDIFAFAVIAIIMASLLHENQRYEKELKVSNFLLEAEKDKYHHLSQVDQLTGLPNRRYFTKSLHDKIEALSAHECLTVFFIDLDNFKQVNDCYGHNIGDQLLLETSKRLRLCFRENDFIARPGGDEFTAAISYLKGKDIPRIIAQRIINEFEQPLVLDNGIEYHYAVSIGYATYPEDAKTATDLIIKADLAMYAAKKIEGNSFWQAD